MNLTIQDLQVRASRKIKEAQELKQRLAAQALSQENARHQSQRNRSKPVRIGSESISRTRVNLNAAQKAQSPTQSTKLSKGPGQTLDASKVHSSIARQPSWKHTASENLKKGSVTRKQEAHLFKSSPNSKGAATTTSVQALKQSISEPLDK